MGRLLAILAPFLCAPVSSDGEPPRPESLCEAHGDCRNSKQGGHILLQQDRILAAGRVQKQTLNVALAVAVTKGFLSSPDWRDGFAVWAYAAKKASAGSRHSTSLLALLPDTLTQEEIDAFAALGMEPHVLPVPVQLGEVQSDDARKELAKGCCGEVENMKYYGAKLVDFDYVLVLDADVMMLKPIDEVLDDERVANAGLIATYDHELDSPGSAFPPIQGGYLLFKPRSSDFDSLVALTKEGDFRQGRGWKGTAVGWAYGGVGPVGLLSFYYNLVENDLLAGPFRQHQLEKRTDLPGDMSEQPADSRLVVLDRSKHDVIDTQPFKEMVSAGKVGMEDVASFHFAGLCLKPWTCVPPRSNICEAMTAKWWELRAEFAESRGLETGTRCEAGSDYEPLNF